MEIEFWRLETAYIEVDLFVAVETLAEEFVGSGMVEIEVVAVH
jgi:hypothetical protein